MKIYDSAVIGGGAAGTMAVLRLVLNNDECLFFPGTKKDKKKSRAFWVTKVENMPAHLDYKKGIENPNKESLDWLEKSEFSNKFHWKKNSGIIKIQKNNEEFFELTNENNEIFFAKYVLICTGVMDIQPKINGIISPVFNYANVQLIDYCLRCDGHHTLNKAVAVIGHTSSAAWVAIMLFEKYQPKKMTIFSNGEIFLFDNEVLELINKYNIVCEEEPLIEIEGEPNKKILSKFKTSNKEFNVDIAFVALGMIVYNELAKMLGAELDNRGFVIANSKGETSVKNLFVAGDLKANTKKQIYTAWDTAVDAAEEINLRIRRTKRLS